MFDVTTGPTSISIDCGPVGSRQIGLSIRTASCGSWSATGGTVLSRTGYGATRYATVKFSSGLGYPITLAVSVRALDPPAC